MGGNSFGKLFTVTTFGESHGPALGAVVDGCPAGVPLSREEIRSELARRRPGGGGASTTRSEADEPEILSGVFEGKTLGTPIAIIIRNAGARSSDYDALKDGYRPGHADWCWEAKYGLRDHRGGGRTSGRETAGRVIGGAVAKAFLVLSRISFRAWLQNAEGVADKAAALRGEGDSVGGVVVCRVEGLPPGLGEPVFGKLDAAIAGAMLSIGAVKGVEFGAGFAATDMRGSEHNDALLPAGDVWWRKDLPPGVPAASFASNHSGGVLGGLSNGMPLEFKVAFKPVPSIGREQKTIDRWGTPVPLTVRGRHDVCVCPRALVVVEAMAAIVIADLLLQNRAARV
ncbi:MAG: chorismate synthase [Spirochaetaceae bacterium]|nr:chorismate synthase [Spirochaetaceae bacterium]